MAGLTGKQVEVLLREAGLRKVAVEVAGECIEWTGARTAAGYGMARAGYVHRLAYEAAVGPIPEGLEIDHLCRNRACCNPAHLEPVPHAENMRRGSWANTTHCPEGHPYDERNTITGPTGGRQCRTCKNARRRQGPPRSNTHCPQGHPKVPENRTGSGDCRPCHRMRNATYKAKRRAA